MPHVIIKMYAGRTEEQKKKLVKAITDSIVKIVDADKKYVSIAIEDVSPEDWAEKVYRPDILEKQNTLYKKPGYNPFCE
ncbi:MAG: 4-oxalocrotonate tautomerase [Candidatus Infernicultor aquiphilus]|uniref:4-oxalocrotonate tautomerase n=1 Tax=Candidatus Infernicultor aquiphilus TaxID=1805029 RepID=A0A1J5GA69_9BACT|nr:4-oxalocrotonate tautomerase family protein [bacterium]OIP69188.1 MAG: 4-oxalocrotonate tautomerase [Candidatus Atribacteria bacterium CG2_30_33_13]PIU25028.1 MAG: 4-oxalocrotonate tautomerase [Candidatus Atribacteria bacterium CG08_land_8_20_14_0_20_33_29]PIW12497.1 MAG: 4-oxalocrotonate tautomerase [Candidatus Atribacteria bacterium CG17_big_fil_post_rev_8_21_14_2_50_34_11]PIX33747.1 MAG: 4-oxalocrotonate tautomerase [Candidatus Atribacteria bacterium CG_4_8_14_3_um_filter_34_18]PIY32439.